MPPELPQELVDHVVDHLWDDIPALLACSRSCYSLLPATRIHLFSMIRLGNGGQCHRFQQLLHESPHIARLVRKLTVSGCSIYCSDPWISQIPSVLAQLIMVDELALLKLRWAGLEWDGKSDNTFAGLKRLVLSDVKFATTAQLQTMLTAIPNVTELEVRNLTYDRISPSTNPSPSVVPIPLEHLLLDSGNCHEVIVDSLLSSGRVSGLRTVSVRWHDPWGDEMQTAYLRTLLSACGPSLEQLSIELPLLMPAHDVWRLGINLDPNYNLRALRVVGLVLPKSCAWAADILAHISSPYLETIDISTCVSYLADIYSMEWTRLDSILAKDLFCGVAVTLHVKLGAGCRDATNVGAVLKSFLPQLRERGKLTVSSF